MWGTGVNDGYRYAQPILRGLRPFVLSLSKNGRRPAGFQVQTKEKATRFAAPAGYPALLDWSGLLINSHDPLRGHVLKHIRRTTPDRSPLLGGAQGR